MRAYGHANIVKAGVGGNLSQLVYVRAFSFIMKFAGINNMGVVICNSRSVRKEAVVVKAAHTGIMLSNRNVSDSRRVVGTKAKSMQWNTQSYMFSPKYR